MEERIEQLKNVLREIMQMVADRGEPLSPEIKQLLGQVIEHITNRILEIRQQEIGQQEGNVEPPPQAPLKMQRGMPSAQVHSFDYDPENQDLYVRFQDRFPAQNGPVYKYAGVPEDVFSIFRRGAVPPRTTGSNKWHAWKKGVMPSLGAALNALIKGGGYDYQRVT